MKRSLFITMLAMVLCFSMSLQVAYAAQLTGTNETQIEVGDPSAQPRAILHVSKSEWVKNDTIKLIVNYSKHDSTADIVGVQSVYVSEYSNALYRNVEVEYFSLADEPAKWVNVSVKYQNINSSEWQYFSTTINL